MVSVLQVTLHNMGFKSSRLKKLVDKMDVPRFVDAMEKSVISSFGANSRTLYVGVDCNSFAYVDDTVQKERSLHTRLVSFLRAVAQICKRFSSAALMPGTNGETSFDWVKFVLYFDGRQLFNRTVNKYKSV